MKKFEVSFPYFLEYPIKVVSKKINLLGFYTWFFQRFWNTSIKNNIKEENIIVSERIVEVPSVYYLLGLAGAKPGHSILDIGHVNSPVSLELANLGYLVTGIDLRGYPFNHPNLTNIQGDFFEFDFNRKFDFIITISTIEHFGFNERYGGEENKDTGLDRAAFKKIHNLLNSNGKFLLTIPYASHRRFDTWFKTYTREDIENLLLEHFIIDRKEYFYRDGNNWIGTTKDRTNDPELPYDGVGIFLLTKK